MKDKIKNLPEKPGVYLFKKGRGVLYIGKATNIKERVKNHFQQPTYRDNLFINQVKKVDFIKTDSEIEALLLEAKLIKKYKPRYNIVWRDDKNYFYVAITKPARAGGEDLPRVLITHQPKEEAEYIGPFVEGTSLKRTLTYLRRVFPYYTAKKHPKGNCLWCSLKLCPGPAPVESEYKNNIKNLVSVLKGSSKKVLSDLKKEMGKTSLIQNYEKAAKIRDKVRALERVISHARVLEPSIHILSADWQNTQKTLQKILNIKGEILRIEAYDVSNIQGKESTGSMVSFINGQPEKSLYRKFRVKIQGKPDDVAMIKETLLRRFGHPEWGRPDLILIDGGKPQLNVAVNSKSQIPNSKRIRIMAIAKKKNELFIEGRKNPILLKSLPREIFNLILQLRDEAHRFAITYHHKLRKRILLEE